MFPMKIARILSRSIATLAALSPLAAYSAADTLSGASPAWATAANWSLGAIPGIGDNAILTATGTVDVRGSALGGSKEIQDLAFASTAALSLVNNSSSVDMLLILNGGRGAGVPLIATTGNFAYAITGPGTNATPHPLSLQLKASGAISVAANTLTITSAISQVGAQSISKTGAGRLILGGVNTFSGGVNVTGGVLEVTANSGLGTGPTVVNGGTLEVNIAAATLTTSDIEVNAGGQIATRGNVTLSNSFTLNGGTLATRSSDGGVFAGAVNVVANSFANLRSYTTPANSQSITVSGLLSGSSSLTINGNNPQTNGLNKAFIVTNPANTFSGVWNVGNGQNLRNLPATTGRTIGGGTVNLNGGGLQLRDDGAGNDGVIAYGNNVVVSTGASAIDVDNVNAVNTGNTFELGTLSIGAQTLSVSGANGYAVRFTGATTLTGAATFHPTTAPLILDGAVGGAFDLTKTGGGVLQLNALNSHTGNTFINEGTLILKRQPFSPRINVNAGATLDVTGTLGGFAISGTQILSGDGAVVGAVSVSSARIEAGDALGAGTLTFSSLVLAAAVTDAASVRVSPAATALGVNVTDVNGLTANGSVSLDIGGLTPAVGQYVLIDYNGVIGGGFGSFRLGTLPTPRLVASLVNNTVNTSIDLNVTGFDFPVWKGALSTEWSTTVLPNPKNWVLESNNAIPTDFLVSDTVKFNDLASGAAPVVNVSVADVVPSAVEFSNNTKPYTITGTKAIAGITGLSKFGAAKVTIANTNSFTGPVLISDAGTISVAAVADSGVNSPLGAGTTITLDDGTLEFTGASGSTNRPIALGVAGGTLSATAAGSVLTLTGVVSGDGLAKSGAGKVILTTAVNTYTTTTILGGTLQVGDGTVNGTLGSGAIVNDGTLAFINPLAQTVATEISGTGALTKTGSGNLVLSGANPNTFTGTTTVSGGNVILSKTSGLDAIGGNLVVETGGTVSYGTTAGQLQDHIADTAQIFITGGTFGSGAGNTDAAPTQGVSDTVASVTIASGKFLTGRPLSATPTPFVVTGAFVMTGGTALVQRGAGLNVQSLAVASPAVLNLDGGSATPGNESRLTIGTGGLTLAGATINFNAGPSAVGATSVGSVINLNGDLTSSGTSSLARLNPTVSAAVVDLGAAVRTFSVTGILTVAPDVGVAATDLATAGILKNGAGKLVLEGAQNYASLTNDAGRTDVSKAIGTGTSTVTANAGQVNFAASQTLESLVIGNGATVTLGAPLPPAPPEEGMAFAAGFSGAENAVVSSAAVPEPGSAALLFGGVLTLLGLRRRD